MGASKLAAKVWPLALLLELSESVRRISTGVPPGMVT
jgi:hypothetical protein